MSGETTMYTLKPIVSLLGPLHRTETMYKMRNIHEDRHKACHTGDEIKIVPDITEQTVSPEYTLLEARQEKILAQLADLRKQVSTLCDFLKPTKQAVSVSDCHIQEPVKVNLILNANPKRPPYSILALQRAWKDTDVRVQSYVHSTVVETPPITFDSKNESSKKNVISLTLIWKEVNDVELVTGLRGYHVTGESNLLRYLSRLINTHNYENSTSLNQILTTDTVLDLCYCLHFEQSSKERQELLSALGDSIDTSWIGKGEAGIADIVAWSTIKQVCSKKVPSNLSKWFETCEKLFS